MNRRRVPVVADEELIITRTVHPHLVVARVLPDRLDHFARQDMRMHVNALHAARHSHSVVSDER